MRERERDREGERDKHREIDIYIYILRGRRGVHGVHNELIKQRYTRRRKCTTVHNIHVYYKKGG